MADTMVYSFGDILVIELIATIILLCIVVVPMVVAAFLVSPYMGFAMVAVMAIFWSKM